MRPKRLSNILVTALIVRLPQYIQINGIGIPLPQVDSFHHPGVWAPVTLDEVVRVLATAGVGKRIGSDYLSYSNWKCYDAYI